MNNKQANDLLDRVWERKPAKRTDWPGTQDDFLSFLQVPRETLLTTHFTLYDTLPGLATRGMGSLGGAVKFLGAPTQHYSWRYYCSSTGENWEAGNQITASAPTREEAALRGVVVLWELITRRQKQSSRSSAKRG